MRRTFSRDFYLPSKYSVKVKAKKAAAEAYLYEHGDLLFAMGFGGKRAKPDFHLRFANEQRRAKYVADYLAGQETRAKDRAERQAKRNAFEHTLEEGDILYSSWGYDQTNIDFYQVTKVVSKKSVKIRQIGGAIDHHDGCQSNYVTASKDSFLEGSRGRERLKRVGEGNVISLNSFSSAHPWDGKPKRETDAWSGH
jgi:hypothetical protein